MSSNSAKTELVRSLGKHTYLWFKKREQRTNAISPTYQARFQVRNERDI